MSVREITPLNFLSPPPPPLVPASSLRTKHRETANNRLFIRSVGHFDTEAVLPDPPKKKTSSVFAVEEHQLRACLPLNSRQTFLTQRLSHSWHLQEKPSKERKKTIYMKRIRLENSFKHDTTTPSRRLLHHEVPPPRAVFVRRQDGHGGGINERIGR